MNCSLILHAALEVNLHSMAEDFLKKPLDCLCMLNTCTHKTPSLMEANVCLSTVFSFPPFTVFRK